MSDNKSIAIVFAAFFLSVGGCCTMREYQEGLTSREKEKTRRMQMEIQARIDSTQLANQKMQWEETQR